FMFEDTSNSSHIVATPFSLNILNLFAYNSSPGGVEHAVYQGMGGNDNLTFNTPNAGLGGNSIIYTPGTFPDAGNIASRTFGGGTAYLPLDFFGLGITGTITYTSSLAARVDDLTVNGTSNSDRFTVLGTGDANNGTLQISKVAPPANNETLVMNTRSIG